MQPDPNCPGCQYQRGRLENLQTSYNRLATWIRHQGHDPVAIANGVEIGERFRVERICTDEWETGPR